MLAKVEAKVAPPPRVRLSVIIDDTDDEAERKKKQEKALAEHIAAHSATRASLRALQGSELTVR